VDPKGRDSADPSAATDDWQARLAEAMEARRLSGGELARRAGFTSQYINSLRSGGRGARLPLDTARKLAHALGVSVDWLTKGDGPRERLSDVFVRVGADPYPSRAEAIALLGAYVAPEVIEALKVAVPEDGVEPDRDYWIRYAKDLSRDLRRIKDDPDLNLRPAEGGRHPEGALHPKDAPPKSAYVPLKNKG
jgi:transcriptional regulator with XRE-family HTH domain